MIITMNTGRHLDLGCGSRPRNPYEYNQLCGVDIVRHPDLAENIEFRLANLATGPIPFEDNGFDSVSAFDFIEHIPRVLSDGADGTRLPFIELMNEIWRVLKPDGRFYAITPAYPGEEVFRDPTHVNIITRLTHNYFCDERRFARNYGFHGAFEAVQVAWVHPRLNATAAKSFKKTCKSLFRSMVRGKRKTHLLWEFRAIKRG